MMYRYITLLWNRTDKRAERAADYVAARLPDLSPHRWRKAWSASGIAVFDSGEHKGRMQTYRLAEDGGVVLGRLFKNDYSSQTEDLDAAESRACLKTRGQHLIDNYWGRYVAFLSDPASGTRWVMRDPSGAFPCFVTPFRGVEIYFSDMQDAANLDFLPFTVNWDSVKANIMLPQFQKTITGLNEVAEVLPAECVEIAATGKSRRFLWDPAKIAETDVIDDPREAAARLRETVMKTIGALAGCYDRVVHNLGGLDSSIVLAGLAQAPNRPEVAAINFYTKSPRGEERFYSRQAADKYHVPLVEKELDYRKVDVTRIFRSNKLANPLGFFDCIGLTGDVLALAKEHGGEALFYGVGGDNVFYKMPRNFGALDYVRRHGLFGKDVLRVSVEASRYGRKALAATWRDMLRERFVPAPAFAYVYDSLYEERKLPFINPEFISAGGDEALLHPLLLPDDRAAKGKFLHILVSAFFNIEYYDHWDPDYAAERLHAYLTQPIVELCLRIPVWVLTHGGEERGLARMAFQHDLPQDVVKRQSKSTPSEYYRDIYENNVPFLREVLLDGAMVREGILLGDRLDQVLKGKEFRFNVWHSQILGYAGMEAWLRGWLDRSSIPAKIAI